MVDIWPICLMYFAGILLCSYIGYRMGKQNRLKTDHGKNEFDETKGGIITILSLLIGFTFGMSGDRYQSYKAVMIDEVNCISTARLRSDLYPEPYHSEFRKYFSEYIEARISHIEAGTNLEKLNESKRMSEAAGEKIWKLASRLYFEPVIDNASRLMVPAVNEMLDAATTREAKLRSKVPVLILIMLMMTTFVAVFISGYGSINFRKKEIIFVVSFAVVITLVTYVILDFDRPDSGLIKPNVEQDAMIELRKIL